MIPMLALMVGSAVMQGAMQDKAKAKDVKSQNKAINKQNYANRLEAEAQVLSLDAQRSALRMQTAKTLDLANRAASASTGGVQAAAGASAIKGATVDSILGDVERDYQEKVFEVETQHEWAEYDIGMQGLNTLRQTQLGNTQTLSQPKSQIGAHLTQGLMQAAGVYAQQYFKFGSGSNNGATGSYSTSSAYGPTRPTYQ